MFKRTKVFITIHFDYVPGLFDYPKHLPIPRIGETILLDDRIGIVSNVKHMTSGSITEIKIVCSKL